MLADIGKIKYGYYLDDKGMVKEGFIDLAVDSVALILPFVPAGTSKVIRNADNITDAAKKTEDGISAARAYTHSFEYNPRVRERALQDPKAHNFPYSFDDVILATKPTRQPNGSDLYRVEGSMSGRSGYYEIATNPKNNQIIHRTFVRK